MVIFLISSIASGQRGWGALMYPNELGRVTVLEALLIDVRAIISKCEFRCPGNA